MPQDVAVSSPTLSTLATPDSVPVPLEASQTYTNMLNTSTDKHTLTFGDSTALEASCSDYSDKEPANTEF